MGASRTSAGRIMFSEVLQQVGTDWKLGGLYIKPAQVAGHDSEWFLARAREYKTKGQLHNAWFYYEEARSLISPQTESSVEYMRSSVRPTPCRQAARPRARS